MFEMNTQCPLQLNRAYFNCNLKAKLLLLLLLVFFSRAIWFSVVFVLATLGLYGIFFQLYISIVWRFFICLLIAAFKIHVLRCFPSRFYHQQRNKLSFRILCLSFGSYLWLLFYVSVWIYLFHWPLSLWENSKTNTKRCPSYVYVEQTCWKVLKTQIFYHLNTNNDCSIIRTISATLRNAIVEKIIFGISYLKRYQFQLVDHWNLMKMSVFFYWNQFPVQDFDFGFWHTNYGFCLRIWQMIRNDLQFVEMVLFPNLAQNRHVWTWKRTELMDKKYFLIIVTTFRLAKTIWICPRLQLKWC